MIGTRRALERLYHMSDITESPSTCEVNYFTGATPPCSSLAVLRDYYRPNAGELEDS